MRKRRRSGPRPCSALPCARGPLAQCAAEIVRSAPECAAPLACRHLEVTPFYVPNFRMANRELSKFV
jgi:hypothetical protein